MSVDGRYDIELNGQGLPVKSYQKLSEDIYVSPKDLATSAGESPLSSFWWQKRFSDFSGGGGQKYAESKNAQDNRILDSQDLDFSTPGEARSVKAMAVSLAKTGTNGYLFTALGYLWLVDGTNLYYYNGSAWSSAVATGVTGNITCVADDGAYIYAFGTSGAIRRGTTTGWADWHTLVQPGDLLAHKGAIYAGAGRYFRVLTSGTGSTDLLDLYNAGFFVVALCEYNQKIAVGVYKGSAGDEKSYVYESDGTASGSTLLVDDLPDGFKLHGLSFYLDVLYIWGGYELTSGSTAAGILYTYTNNALQIAGHFKEAADMGNPGRQTVPTLDTIPRCALPDGQFVYFGMNERTGLWRYDLKEGGLHRCWSAATTNNLVTGVATYKGKIYLAYSGAGAFVEQTTYQSSGWLTTPNTTLGTSNPKVGRVVRLSYTDKSSPTGTYDGSALPAASTPAWTKAATGSPTEAVSSGILTTTGTGTSTQSYSLIDNNLANAQGTMLEARLKIDSSSSGDGDYPFHMDIRDGTKNAFVHFDPAKVRLSGTTMQVYNFNTTDDYHTYRLTLKGTTAKLYIDGALVATSVISATTSSKDIIFGDAQASPSYTHTEYWDYVKYWRTGAFAPGEEGVTPNPFTVEVSKDDGTSRTSLVGSSDYKEYDLSPISLWASLQTKVTLSNSNVILNDITIEAVPTLPSTNYWLIDIPLSDTIDTLDGSEESINAQTVYEALQTARDNKIPITFKEKDWDIQTTQTVKKVLIEKLDQIKPIIEDGVLESCDLKIKLREF